MPKDVLSTSRNDGNTQGLLFPGSKTFFTAKACLGRLKKTYHPQSRWLIVSLFNPDAICDLNYRLCGAYVSFRILLKSLSYTQSSMLSMVFS